MPKIETIRASDGNEVSLCSERGGIITSLQLHGKEILFLDKETFNDPTKNVRGGIPILFPNSGPIESSEFPGLMQHGFARNSSKWAHQKEKSGEGSQSGFEEILLSGDDNRKVFPYDFRLSIKGAFEEDGSFLITQEARNLEESKDMPIAMGLHPYFRVRDIDKSHMEFEFEGGAQIEEQFEKWSSGNAISIDNPKILDPAGVIKVIIPRLGTLLIEASVEYRKIKVWTLPGTDFVCIEPVMRDDGGLITDPEILKPGQVFSAHVRFSLQN